jgi:alpha-glucosidase
MVAGPMDYIPFTTHNATRKNFRPVGDMPMGQGTRAHSMALFVILESPMQMLPDSPSDYYRERECTEFISTIPTEWDDLKVLYVKVGAHTVLARKNEDNWYIGAITNWDKKSFTINFDFLGEGEYQLEYIADGINADTRAIDYVKRTKRITSGDTIEIDLAPGGGWIAKLVKTGK